MVAADTTRRLVNSFISSGLSVSWLTLSNQVGTSRNHFLNGNQRLLVEEIIAAVKLIVRD
jgi:hypothetical protein